MGNQCWTRDALFICDLCREEKNGPRNKSRESCQEFFLLLGLLAPVDGSELRVSANLFLRSPQPSAPEFALQKRAFVEFWKPPDFFVITL